MRAYSESEAMYQRGYSDAFKTFDQIRQHRDNLLKVIEHLEDELARSRAEVKEWREKNGK